jgi:hypothetical protein
VKVAPESSRRFADLAIKSAIARQLRRGDDHWEDGIANLLFEFS